MGQSIKHAWRITSIVGCLGVLCGCWDNRDIDHRSLPVTMGLAYHDNLYDVVLQIPEPQSNGTNIRIIKQSGKTINEAVDKISERMESSVDLLHLKLILIEKGYAQQGLTDSISSFMRSRDISPKAIIAICNEDLGPFFDFVKKSMSPKGTTLYDCFEKNAGWNPQMALTHIWQVYRSIHSYTRDIAIPVIKSGKSGTIDYEGSAIIKNGKMIDQITPEETLLFNSFTGQSAQGKIEVMDKASVLVLKSSMHHHSKLIRDTPYLDVQITMKVSILETKGSVSSEVIKQELKEILTKRFNRMFRKTQVREADILGLGQYYRNKIPRTKLRHWRTEYLPKLRLNLKVKTIIQNEGNTKLE
ncbi:Ger(x)C family spore germination protein [Paenibacillus rhizovicinus]|uniref:Ger(X)C family spore germination protein n=1 Tax=Paenibacillus rhizovicinus TaxID=2704463 RepID=A0A6C0P7I2_9BACL|nr:Ger(x)C family spore germination protein [Paenibacillus rhizovicinus]QHW33603.1 Ger(x)C family spore germination protein [Paenibacillus rhizovicinus]